MGDMSGVVDLIAEIKSTRDQIQTADAERLRVMEELRKGVETSSKSLGDTEGKLTRVATDIAAHETKMQALQEGMNNIIRRMTRPGGDHFSDATVDERKEAIELLEQRHRWKVTKVDTSMPFQSTEEQITEASLHLKATRALLHSTDVAQLTPEYRKALSSFTMGANGFILPPEMSSKILSCLVYPTDVAGLMNNMTVAGPSIKFMVDNVLLDTAAWACETSCFANNPNQHLTDGLGELEIKPETLRYIVCATRDLLEDAATNIEAWLIGKVQRAFGITIGNAIINGDGVGKPLGILNPHTGIIICDTGANTPAGQFTWQDLVMLKWQVPMQFQTGSSYFMNQYTMGQALTLSDSMGRPILLSDPTEGGGFMIAGSPVVIVTQMPSVAPGTTPVAFGNWKEVYMVVNRKAVTMLQDPYSAGFCILFKFESRVGGAVICANAARLLRIR